MHEQIPRSTTVDWIGVHEQIPQSTTPFLRRIINTNSYLIYRGAARAGVYHQFPVPYSYPAESRASSGETAARRAARWLL